MYYLAVDIGASSGRHILAHMEDGRIVLEEIYRFENGVQEMDGMLCWDVDRLYAEIIQGMKKCRELNKIPISMGIDTWAVDFVLLDEAGNRISKAVSYRDGRTKGMDELVYRLIPEKQLYERTGIQKQIFNTIYQLMAVKEQEGDLLEKADSFLMIPDYFHYLLTGKKAVEYTNATSTQLVNPKTCDWDMELIETLGYPKKLFPSIVKAGTSLGHFTEAVQREVGFDCEVVLPATHDTASAVLAVPAKEKDFVYISSGTWSLMGVEQMHADCTEASGKHNFTNEGGYDYRYCYLKNIMGLWMIQNIKKELEEADGIKRTYGEICSNAETCNDFPSIIDVNDASFLSPKRMIDAVSEYCEKNNLKVPEKEEELAACVYKSLAHSYQVAVEELEELTGKTYDTIYIVGGGSNAEYLNRLTGEYTKRRIHTGPVEGTAIGNIMVQMLEKHVFETVEEARNCVEASFCNE